MHAEVVQFLRSQSCANIPWHGATVYEVGSLDVNGQARDVVPEGWSTWLGFDLVEGLGVDHVGDAATILPTLPQCDIMVSTEVLEHAPDWQGLLSVMCDSLVTGGWLVLTCAGTGRPPHAADGSGPPHVGEYYANVSLHEVVVQALSRGVVYQYGEEGYPGDTRYVGRKT